MFMKPLTILIFFVIMNYKVYASESQCASPLLKNLTDQIQSSIAVALLKSAQILLDDGNRHHVMQAGCFIAESVYEKPMDCFDIMEQRPSASNGVYKIWPRSLDGALTRPIDVYCDMEDDGGAWTVLQRRGDFGSRNDYFYRGWQSYKHGFGDLKKDFWIGNDKIFLLTNQRANIVKFTLTDWEQNTSYAIYDDFWIQNEAHGYLLHLEGYSGTAGDSMSRHIRQEFSTKDNENDSDNSRHCAVERKGAWWYKDCSDSNLNGLYFKEAVTSDFNGIFWLTSRGANYSLKDTVIKIRPYDFHKNMKSDQPH